MSLDRACELRKKHDTAKDVDISFSEIKFILYKRKLRSLLAYNIGRDAVPPADRHFARYPSPQLSLNTIIVKLTSPVSTMEAQEDSSQTHYSSDPSSRLYINGRVSSRDAEFLTKDEEHAIKSWVFNAPDPPPCFQDFKDRFGDIFNNHKSPDAGRIKSFLGLILDTRRQNGPIVSAQSHLLLSLRPRLNTLISRTRETHSHFQAMVFL